MAFLFVTLQPVKGAYRFNESFDNFNPAGFRTKIPNKNTSVRDGALWTRGKSGGKYPPMVYLDVEGETLRSRFVTDISRRGAGCGFSLMAMTASEASITCCV